MVKKPSTTTECYLLAGEDRAGKEVKIAELKKKFLTGGSLNFDYEVLFGHKLSADELKKSLMSLPALMPKRFILLHESNKLSADSKKIIQKFLKEGHDHLVLVLVHDTKQDAFVKSVNSYSTVIDYSFGREDTVFDMTRLITQRRVKDALKILSELFNKGQHPLQIMGALVWFWGKTKNRVSRQKFTEGLNALQEADLNIKRSRIKAEYAVELLVVKLAGLV